MKRSIFAISLSLGLAACAGGKDDKKKASDDSPPAPEEEGEGEGEGEGTGTDGTTDTETGVKTTPVLAFFGGYTSCGTGDTGDPFKQDLKAFFDGAMAKLEAKLGAEPKFVITCYTLSYESILYRISGEEGVKDKLIEGMESDFEDFLGTLENPELFLVGHSYGGWTAMDVAIKRSPGVKVKAIVTLDPISHTDCTTNDVIEAAFNPIPGCTRAPEDFSPEKIKALAEDAGEWLNYWQDKVSFLHSGEIKGAKNFKLDYEGTGFEPHNAFLFDEAVGKEISALVEKSF